MSPSVPFIGINRNRLATDGFGVTTLAAFWGCPLSCLYCLNPQSLDSAFPAHWFTPEELYDQVRIDELYFLATCGGITFGGGEPALYPDFIRKFRTLCGDQWKITLESSLNVPKENIERLFPIVDDYIVDIKDMDMDIYKKYTGKKNTRSIANLTWHIAQGKADQITVRIPAIPGFNTTKDQEESIRKLREMGVKKMDVFSYKQTPSK